MIGVLRTQLRLVEEENPYPDGICSFCKQLTGQGFFPGGDGLWREDSTPEGLSKVSSYPFPIGGVMFLGNDFGTAQAFSKLQYYENPPTWKHLRRRINDAGIPGEAGFFTNAYLGLRTDRSALAVQIKDSAYQEMCCGYLKLQIAHQKPKLIVVLGTSPAGLLSKALERKIELKKGITETQLHGENIGIFVTSHPYSDQFVRKAERKHVWNAEVEQLGLAYKRFCTN